MFQYFRFQPYIIKLDLIKLILIFPLLELNALISLLDLFVAGAETSSSILQWAMLALIKWPQVQAKVQEEIDRVVGPNRLPSLDDRAE